MIHSRPANLVRAQLKRFEAIGADVRAMHKDLAEQGKVDFMDLTGGGISKRQLAALGHPFGRGNSGGVRGVRGGRQTTRYKWAHVAAGKRISRGVLDPLPINIQTGELRAKMHFDYVRGPSGRQSFDLGSKAPHEPFIFSPTGTGRMTARGYFPEVKTRWKARNSAFVRFLRQAWDHRTN